MKTIEKEQLIEYLKHGISIASELYGLEHIFNNFKDTCERNKPVLIEKPLPDQPIAKPSKSTNSLGNIWFLFGAIFLFAGIGMISVNGTPDSAANVVTDVLDGFIGFMAWLCIIAGIILFIAGFYTRSKAKNMSIYLKTRFKYLKD